MKTHCTHIGHIFKKNMYPLCPVPKEPSCGYGSRMSKRLKEAREAKGLSQTALGLAVKSGRSQIAKLEGGDRKLTREWANRLAPVLEVDPAELLDDNEGFVKLSVTEFVKASYWSESEELPIEERYELFWPMSEKYKRLRAVQVKGDSVNKYMDDGDTAIICPIEDYPESIEDGQFVIVRRTSVDGLSETTIKVWQTIDGDVWLTPYSTNPDHASFRLQPTRHEAANIQCVEIMAVVVDVARKRPPRIIAP